MQLGGEDTQQGGGWRTGRVRQQLADPEVPHLQSDKPGVATGERDRLLNPGFQCGEIKPHNP